MLREFLEVLSTLAWGVPPPEKMIESRNEVNRMFAFMVYWLIWLFIICLSIFATILVTFLTYLAGKLLYDFANSDSRSERARRARAG